MPLPPIRRSRDRHPACRVQFGKVDVSVSDTNIQNVTVNVNYQETYHGAVGALSKLIYRSLHEQMAARSADQAVAYLSEFFAKEGWIPEDIPEDKVMKAKRDDR